MTNIDRKESKKRLEFQDIEAIVGKGYVLEDELIANHTSIKIGGPADYFIKPQTVEILKSVLLYLKDKGIPFYIMGNGSNVFADDFGYKGAIIQIYKLMSDIQVEGQVVIAQSGVLLSKLASRIADKSLTGFEFASGIPGTLGGAVFMNAGAYDGEMKDVLLEVEVIDYEGHIMTIPAEELALGYRTSILQEKKLIALKARMKLSIGDEVAIRDKMKDLNQRRKDKQPLELPSAGSAFKRPTGYYAGKLIMDAGLSGYRVGGASVSTKHCGFIVNDRNATSEDLVKLIEHIKQVVYRKFNVILEPEIRLIS